MSEWKEGLPGVGVKCEVLDPKSGGWNRIEITGEGCDVLIAKRFERSEEEFMLNKTCEFRPIKKREPQPGEVWEIDSEPYLIAPISDTWVGLNGKSYIYNMPDRVKPAEYAAPDVKSYIARELWSAGIKTCRYTVKQAARLDEE